MAMSVKRLFFYGPFSITTGSMIASGLGYNGKSKVDGSDQWDKVVQVYVWNIETGTTPLELLRYWNHQVHLWLKFYVGLRLVKKGGRQTFFSSMATFIVSAFWHGFYPFYYVMFFFAAISNEVSKDLFKARKFLFYPVIPAILRPVLANLATMIVLNYFGTIFTALTFENGMKFMANTYYFVPISLFVILAFTRQTKLVKRAAKWEESMNVKKAE
jgi:lysophospholipid acyltransferase